jgi:hypothetical protein
LKNDVIFYFPFFFNFDIHMYMKTIPPPIYLTLTPAIPSEKKWRVERYKKNKLLVKTWAGRLWNTSPARRGDVEVGTVKRGPGERRTWGQSEAEPVGAK